MLIACQLMLIFPKTRGSRADMKETSGQLARLIPRHESVLSSRNADNAILMKGTVRRAEADYADGHTVPYTRCPHYGASIVPLLDSTTTDIIATSTHARLLT